MEIVKWILANWSEVLNLVLGVFSALVALFLIIPGEQPEKSLQKIVAFLSRFSRKSGKK